MAAAARPVAATWPKTSQNWCWKLPGDLVPDAQQRGSQRRLAFIGSNGRDDTLQELLGAAAEVDRQCGRIGSDAHPVASQQLQPERPAGFILLVLDRDGQIGRFLPRGVDSVAGGRGSVGWSAARRAASSTTAIWRVATPMTWPSTE